MTSRYMFYRPAYQRSIWRSLFVMILIAAQLFTFLGAKPATALSLTSLLGIDDLAHKTLNQIDQVINNTQGALHDELSNLHSQVSDIVNQLETTYKDLLNVSLNSLDATIQQFATTLANQLDDINTKINQDITNAQQALIGLIQNARAQLGITMSQFQDSASKIIVLTTESTVFVLDRAAWNTIGVGAVLILLIGLLIIPVVLIWRKGWPLGIAGIVTGILVVLFVVVGALLAFVPSAKAQALKAVGKGTEAPTIEVVPQIFDALPNPILLGQTHEITIDGVHLILNQTQPVVTINGTVAAIRAAGENQIVITAPSSGADGTVQLKLAYNNGQQTVGIPITLRRPTATPSPAQILMSNFYVSPSNPVAGSTIVNAYVTATNQGGITSQQFDIVWTPLPNTTFNIHVPALNPGTAQQFSSSTYTYPHDGTFPGLVRSSSTQMGNNPTVLTNTVIVKTPTPTPTPTPGPAVTITTGLVDASGAWGLTCDMRHDFEADLLIPAGYQWNGDADGVKNSIILSGSRGANAYAVGEPWVDGQTLKLIVHIGAGSLYFSSCGTLYYTVTGKATPKP